MINWLNCLASVRTDVGFVNPNLPNYIEMKAEISERDISVNTITGKQDRVFSFCGLFELFKTAER